MTTGQPVGHLCDLLGIDRFWPEVFDAMVDIVAEPKEGADSWENPAIDWDAQFARFRR